MKLVLLRTSCCCTASSHVSLLVCSKMKLVHKAQMLAKPWQPCWQLSYMHLISSLQLPEQVSEIGTQHFG